MSTDLAGAPAEEACAETTRVILENEQFLRALARRLHRCDADVDDLVQETLLRAYRARDRYMPGTCLRAWLATILRRKHLTDRLTQKRRRTETCTDALRSADRQCAPELIVDGDVRKVYAAALERLDDRLRHAFDALPDTFREVFVLHALGGLSYEEIAEKLRVPRGTVMSRLHRARLRLRSAVYALERSVRMLQARRTAG